MNATETLVSVSDETAGDAGKAIRVGVLGTDERSKKALGLAFDTRANGMFAVVDAAHAEVLIVDLDGPDGVSLREDFEKQGAACPVVFVSSTQQEVPGARFVKKPIAFTALIDALVASSDKKAPLAEAASKAARSTRVTADAANSLSGRTADDASLSGLRKRRFPNSDTLFFNPENFVLGPLHHAIEEARASNRIAIVNCLHDRKIFLDPLQNDVVFNLTDAQFRNLGIITIHGTEGVPVNTEFCQREQLANLLPMDAGAIRSWSLDRFLWQLTVMTSRGRAPMDTDLSAPMYLRHWPNLTRYEEIPNAIKICAFWLQQPRSLLDLFDNLQVPFEHVMSLYSAASAIGLAGEANRKSDTMISPPELKQHAKRNLFSAIVNKFRKPQEAMENIAMGA